MLGFHPSVVIDLTFENVDLVGTEDEPMPTVEEVDLEYHREPEFIDLDGNTNPRSLTASDDDASDLPTLPTRSGGAGMRDMAKLREPPARGRATFRHAQRFRHCIFPSIGLLHVPLHRRSLKCSNLRYVII